MPNEDYHKAEGLSRSRLMDFARGFEHYEYATTHIIEPTDEMEMGTALHEMVLQPELNRIVAYDGRRAGKEWESFKQINDGKIILPQKNYKKVIEMREAVYKHTIARQILVTTPSFAEVSIFWEDEKTGTPLKVRSDFIISQNNDYLGFIADLKTTSGGGAEESEFCKTVEKKYGYDMQAWMNLEGANKAGEFGKIQDFLWIVVEKEPPYRVEVYKAHEEHIEGGGIRFYQLLNEFLKYKRDPVAYREAHKAIKQLSPSRWYGKDFE